MEIKCNNCHNNINKIIQKNFDEYIVGRYQCSNCKNKQQRYISELDLMIYFGISCTSYALSIFLVFSIFQYINNLIFIAIFVVILFVFLFFLFRYMPLWIYEKAPLKHNWKTYNFKEEEKPISKRMKWQFIMFLLVSFMFGTSEQYTYFFYILIVLFIGIVFIKIKLLYNKEKEIFSRKKGVIN
ncbi:MAG: hypothetical protein GX675_00625 [Erysipelotrichaceae bacterium]|nr:hypothetical protein [Erysipelotrichaceae bacterium]